MNRTTVALVVLGLAAGMSTAQATARHDLVGRIQKTSTGARVTLRFSPASGYNTVTAGVSPGAVGRSSSPRKVFEHGLRLSGPTERSYDIAYDGQFRSGGTFTIISHWPGGGRVHKWGTDSHTLP